MFDSAENPGSSPILQGRCLQRPLEFGQFGDGRCKHRPSSGLKEPPSSVPEKRGAFVPRPRVPLRSLLQLHPRLNISYAFGVLKFPVGVLVKTARFLNADLH